MTKQGDIHATESGYEPGSFLRKRSGSPHVVQEQGNLRELGTDPAGSGEEANPGGGVCEEAAEPVDERVDRKAIADLIRAEAEEIAKETKHGNLLTTIDKAAKAIATAATHDASGDARIADCIDAQTKALESCFTTIAKCIDKNTAALDRLAKAEQREVHVEVREEKGAASLTGAVRMLIESNKSVIEAIHALVEAERNEPDPKPTPAPKPSAGSYMEIERGHNGEMTGVKVTPLVPHPITGRT